MLPGERMTRLSRNQCKEGFMSYIWRRFALYNLDILSLLINLGKIYWPIVDQFFQL